MGVVCDVLNDCSSKEIVEYITSELDMHDPHGMDLYENLRGACTDSKECLTMFKRVNYCHPYGGLECIT